MAQFLKRLVCLSVNLVLRFMLKVTVEETMKSMDAMDASDTETITLVRNKSSGDIYLLVLLSIMFVPYKLTIRSRVRLKESFLPRIFATEVFSIMILQLPWIQLL